MPDIWIYYEEYFEEENNFISDLNTLLNNDVIKS